jgi:hypothetical protein
MDVPIHSTRGRIISERVISFDGYNFIDFDITGNKLDRFNNIESFYIKFRKPCFYGHNHADHCYGELTRRKNRKYMFMGHTRLYSNERVEFFED